METLLVHVTGARYCAICSQVKCGSILLPNTDEHACDDCIAPVIERFVRDSKPWHKQDAAPVGAEYDAGLELAAENQARRDRFGAVAAEHNDFLAHRGGRT